MCLRLCAILIFALIVSVTIVSSVFANSELSCYSGLLVPTADSASRMSMAGYLLTFPAGVVGELSLPTYGRATALVHGGISAYPAGFLGSVSLRGHLLKPDPRRWGLAAQIQLGAAAAFWGGEGDGGSISALHLVASSPVKPTRVNFGVTIHTMPGSEYQTGWENAKEYDLKNPQTTVFVSGGHSFGKTTVFSEMSWIAIGADEGWDSVFLGLVGVKFSFRRMDLRIGGGIIVERFRSTNSRVLPLPPVVAVAASL